MKKTGYVLALIGLLSFGGIFLWSQFQGQSSPSLSRLYQLPEFVLTERSGKPVNLSDLRGNIWIANFIYTHCDDSCPLQSNIMAQFQKEFIKETDFRMVSITVDPKRDTPAVLTQYAERFEADPERWLFLTGGKEAIYELALNGFRLATIDQSEDEHDHPPYPNPEAFAPSEQGNQEIHSQQETRLTSLNPIVDLLIQWITPISAFAHQTGGGFLHSGRFVLVDRQGHIRGYYRSEEVQQMKKLKQHIRLLLEESIYPPDSTINFQ